MDWIIQTLHPIQFWLVCVNCLTYVCLSWPELLKLHNYNYCCERESIVSMYLVQLKLDFWKEDNK